MNFVVSTIDSQLRDVFANVNTAQTLKLIFEICLPFGFIGIPIMSVLLNFSLFYALLFGTLLVKGDLLNVMCYTYTIQLIWFA